MSRGGSSPVGTAWHLSVLGGPVVSPLVALGTLRTLLSAWTRAVPPRQAAGLAAPRLLPAETLAAETQP